MYDLFTLNSRCLTCKIFYFVIFSSDLVTALVSDTSLWFMAVSLTPFLKTSTIFALFHSLGAYPLSGDFLNFSSGPSRALVDFLHAAGTKKLINTII